MLPYFCNIINRLRTDRSNDERIKKTQVSLPIIFNLTDPKKYSNLTNIWYLISIQIDILETTRKQLRKMTKNFIYPEE